MSGVVVVNQPGFYLVDADGNVVTLADGDTIGTAESLIVAGKDGTVARMMAVDSSGKLAIQNPPNLDAALSTLATESKLEAVRVLLATIDADTSNIDVALSTIATEATVSTLATESKLEAVRLLLASIDSKDFATETTLDALRTDFNAEDFATQTTLEAVEAVLDTIYARQNDRSQKTQLTDGTLDVSVSADATINRLEIQGKVQTVGAIPPPATNPVLISADTPLTVGTQDTTFVIPNGETFHLQQITVGNEDPTKGAVTTVLFDNGTEHVIERVYTAGATVQVGFADITEARDGTALLGNGTNTIVVRREKYAGTNIAIDAEVRGYSS